MAAPKLYKAKNEIHITTKPGKAGDKAKGIAATPPEVTVIPAGGKFTIDPDSDAAKQLIGSGTITPASDDPDPGVTKIATAKKAPAKKAPAKKAAPAKKDDAEDADDGADDGADADDDGVL